MHGKNGVGWFDSIDGRKERNMFRLYRSAIHVLARNHYLCLDTIDGTALLGVRRRRASTFAYRNT